jgi:hypothetical protein
MEEQKLKCVRNTRRNILIHRRMNIAKIEKPTREERQDGSDL